MTEPPAVPPDSGESSVQLVILTPLLVLLIVLGIQVAVYFHAANVAGAAAAQGAAAASPSGAAPQVAADVATATVGELGSDLARPPAVAADSAYVVVTVEVAVPRLLPFFPDAAARTSREPRERFVPESER